MGQISNNKLDHGGSAWLIRSLIFEKLPLTIRELFQNKTNKTYSNLKEIKDNFTTVLSLYNSNNKSNRQINLSSFKPK